MKNTIAILTSLLFACAAAYADEGKSDSKKSEKAKTHAKKKSEKKQDNKSAEKSDKNVFQKTESSVGDWARRNKIWTRSEPRGTAEKK